MSTLKDLLLAAALAAVFAAAIVHWIDLEGITSQEAAHAAAPQVQP